MKSLFFLIVLLIFTKSLFSQPYKVTKVVGVVYYNNTPLKKGDVITDLGRLNAQDQNGAVRLTNPQQGSIPISFSNGKKITGTKAQNSELYELAFADYIKKFEAFKQLGTKNGEFFDWFDFFYNFYNDSVAKREIEDTSYFRRMLIIEDQKIPLESNMLVLEPTDKLLACIYGENKDSLQKELPVSKDSIVFAASAFPLGTKFSWKLKLMAEGSQNKMQVLTLTDYPIVSFVLGKTELMNIIDLFKSDWNDGYKSLDDAKKDLYNFLIFNYGKFYPPALESYINEGFLSAK